MLVDSRDDVATPSPEAARLHALHSYHVLDTPAEARFDRITRFLSKALDVPTALISLVDAERQWFKSRLGMEAESTPRGIAFCAHAIRGSTPLIVEDAREDQRFVHNPLVQGAPHIRFYAGAPLVTPEGHRIGTLCAIDGKPRKLNDEQQLMLRDLAAQVMDMFELRRLTSVKRDVDETLRALSLDLRPGLHQVKSFGELIASDPDNQLTPKSTRYLALVQQVSERTRSRLDAVRDLLKLGETGELVTVHTDKLVSLLLKRFAPVIEEQRASVHVGALPNVLGRRSQVELLFAHLIDNALKYGRSDGAPVALRIEAKPLLERVEFVVSDAGPGIPETQRSRALRLFERLHTGEVQGQGVGLALCRKIVEVSGGALRIEESPTGGTSVRFTLPPSEHVG